MRGADGARRHGEYAGQRDREQRGAQRPATQQAEHDQADDAGATRAACRYPDDLQGVTHREPPPASKR